MAKDKGKEKLYHYNKNILILKSNGRNSDDVLKHTQNGSINDIKMST